uniref:glutathione S-transferase family protein n=1 Tax=Brevundimonas sp. TaxID=1871086 RepID=UPI0028AD6CD9
GDDAAAQEEVRLRTAERIAKCWGLMDSQITPGRFLLGEDLSVLDLYVAVASRWTPRRTRFYAEAPRMAEVMHRVDALPELQSFWSKRFPFTDDA